MAEDGLVFAVRRAEIDFLAPARLDDALVVRSRLTGAAGATLDVAQEIWRDEGVLARLRLRIACVGSGGRPRRLPPALSATILSLIPPARTRVSENAR